MKKKGAPSLPDVTSSAIFPIRESYCFVRAGKMYVFCYSNESGSRARWFVVSANVKRSIK